MARPQTVSDEAVMEAARRVFLKHGAKASMDVVAEQVGISAPALFKRFGSKKDLMVCALAPPVPVWFWRVIAGPNHEPIESQLLSLAKEMDAFFSKMVPCMMVLKEAGIAEETLKAFALKGATAKGFTPQDNTPFPIMARNHLADFIAQASARGDLQVANPIVAAQLMLGGIQSRHFMRHIAGDTQNPDAEANQFVASLVDILVHGFKRQQAEDNASSEEDA